MAITKKLRFEVFKRDSFQCAYCGKNPPEIILEVDHIDPKSKGGKDDINNLITACFDCNRGKGNVLLSKIPQKLSKNLGILKEQESQISEYRKFIKKINRRINKDIRTLSEIYENQYDGWEFSDNFKKISLKKFIKTLAIDEIEDALETAISRFPNDSGVVIKYFCGICWNKIKGGGISE